MRRAAFSLILLGVLTACTTGRTGPGTSTAPLVYDPAERPQRMAYALKFIEAMKSDEEIKADITRGFREGVKQSLYNVSPELKVSREEFEALAEQYLLVEQLKRLSEIKQGYASGYAETLTLVELERLARCAESPAVKRAWREEPLSVQDQSELAALQFLELRQRMKETAPAAQRISQARGDLLFKGLLEQFTQKVADLQRQRLG